jgi:GT2 family glycosyltransferase
VSGPAIAIVTHDSLAHLQRFLDGQLATAERLETVLVVVDNDSRDGSLELLRERAASKPALVLVEMGRNAGYAAAVNAAVAAAPDADDLLLLVNPDVELPGPEPVRELVGFAEAHPRLAVIAPRLVSEDGAAQTSVRRYPTMLAAVASSRRIGKLRLAARSRRRYEEPSSAQVPIEVDWAIGAAMLIRRHAHAQVGGWDERYHLYLEDVDFCLRCRAAGWAVAYVPQVQLRHVYPRASSRPDASVRRNRLRRYHVASFVRFFSRHPLLALGFGRGPGRPMSR